MTVLRCSKYSPGNQSVVVNQNTDSGKGLFKVMVIGTAISFGFLGATVVSMRDFFGGDAAFEFSYKTALGFIGGAFFGWGFWIVVRWLAQKSRNADR